MTENSILCRFISEHPDTWEADLKEMRIGIKKSDSLAIFNYTPECDFHDPLVQEARGIIIDTASCTVTCWPFRKFGNWQEDYADEIDWKSARVQEKIDGSIVKLWFRNGGWHWSTNACIDPFLVSAGDTGLSFGSVILKAENYRNLCFDELDKSCTYIFELVSPYTRLIIAYPETKLYHTGTRRNTDGQEMITDIGIEQPRQFPITDFNSCLKAAEKLNEAEGDVKAEGFVVVDRNWHRIKIKSPEYLAAHHFLNNRRITKANALTVLIHNREAAEEMIRSSKNLAVRIKYYDYCLAKLDLEVTRYIGYVRGLYEELEHDRKAVANTIKKDRFASFGFMAIGNELSSENLIRKVNLKQLGRWIPDFPEK